MKQKFNFILVEEFDLVAIRLAFSQGRLFIQPAALSAAEIREEGIQSILRYVSRIDDCTSSVYRVHIGEIWEQILRDPILGELFFYVRYTRNRGEVNWYRVTVVVCLLREWQVYRDDFTATDLHCMLEGTTRRNSRYTGMSRYLLEGKYFGLIRQKLHNFQQ